MFTEGVTRFANAAAELAEDIGERIDQAQQNFAGHLNQPAPVDDQSGQSGGDGSSSSGSSDAATPVEIASVGIATTVEPLADSLNDAAAVVVDPAAEIARLNSDGDQIVMSMTGEGKLQVPVPIGNVPVGIGVKGQYGFQITVEQVGDHPQPGSNGEAPVYEVTFDKNLLGGGVIEPPIPGIDPAAEFNLRTTGSVTMRFDTPEEAARAVNILQRLALEETLRDTGNAVSPSSSGSNPMSNPVTDNGGSGAQPPNGLADAVAPSDEEMAFLRDNVVSYTSVVGVQERLKVAAKLANLGIEPRFDRNQLLTRTVVLPQDGEPGRLTYTLSGNFDLSTKEKLTIGKQQFDQLEIGYVPQNIVEHGQLYGEVSISWDLPQSAFNTSLSGQPVPEISMLLNGDFLDGPDEVSAILQLDYQTQSPLDLSRTDLQRLSFEMTALNPGMHVGPVLNELMSGNLEGALRGMGEDFTVTVNNETIRRDGVNQQHEIGVEFADIVEAKASLIGEIGLDDVTERHTATFTADQIADRLFGPGAGDDFLVVVPREGLNVRRGPSVDSTEISAFQHGTFVEPTGQEATDAQGRNWIEVRGLDDNNRIVQGWVAGAYLRPHEGGAMDATGRINPALEEQGYEAIIVQPGDTIWDLARREGVDFQEMMELNRDHIIDPSLIFPEDKIYIPGTANPPAESSPSEAASETAQSVRETVSEAAESAEEAASDAAESVDEAASEAAVSADEAVSESAESVDDAFSDDAGSEHEAISEAAEFANQAVSETADSVHETASEAADSVRGEDNAGSLPEGQPQVDDVAVDPSGVIPAPDDPLPLDARADLGAVRRDYQVVTDPRGMLHWLPGGFLSGVVDIVRDPLFITVTEVDMLNGLGPHEQFDMYRIEKEAWSRSNALFPTLADRRGNFQTDEEFQFWVDNDGHKDAFRHAYWSALMTSRFGEDFAYRFATAHEGTLDKQGLDNNDADREAMDLHNNEVGRRIAMDHPDASWEELAGYVMQAIADGELIVIDPNGNLAWSDQVGYGQHARAEANNEGRPDVAPGVIQTPDANWR